MKAVDWNHDVCQQNKTKNKKKSVSLLKRNTSRPFRMGIWSSTPPTPMSTCSYRAVGRKTHKVEESDLCTEQRVCVCEPWCGRSVCYSRARKRCPIGYLHSERDSYSTHWVWLVLAYIWNGLLWRQKTSRSLFPPLTSRLLKWLFYVSWLTCEAQKHWKRWLMLYNWLSKEECLVWSQHLYMWTPFFSPASIYTFSLSLDFNLGKTLIYALAISSMRRYKLTLVKH